MHRYSTRRKVIVVSEDLLHPSYLNYTTLAHFVDGSQDQYGQHDENHANMIKKEQLDMEEAEEVFLNTRQIEMDYNIKGLPQEVEDASGLGDHAKNVGHETGSKRIRSGYDCRRPKTHAEVQRECRFSNAHYQERDRQRMRKPAIRKSDERTRELGRIRTRRYRERKKAAQSASLQRQVELLVMESYQSHPTHTSYPTYPTFTSFSDNVQNVEHVYVNTIKTEPLDMEDADVNVPQMDYVMNQDSEEAAEHDEHLQFVAIPDTACKRNRSRGRPRTHSKSKAERQKQYRLNNSQYRERERMRKKGKRRNVKSNERTRELGRIRTRRYRERKKAALVASLQREEGSFECHPSYLTHTLAAFVDNIQNEYEQVEHVHVNTIKTEPLEDADLNLLNVQQMDYVMNQEEAETVGHDAHVNGTACNQIRSRRPRSHSMSNAERQKKYRLNNPHYRERERLRKKRDCNKPKTSEKAREGARIRSRRYRERKKILNLLHLSGIL